MKPFAVRIWLLLALGMCTGCEIGIEQPADPAAQSSSSNERGQHAGQSRRGQLQFIEGYAAGRSEAARQQKPMLLFFTAGWCDYCHQMAAEAFSNPQVARLSGQFVCVLVDADAEPDVCRQFEVAGYPTIQFLSSRGVPLNRLVGKQPGHQVMMAMQAALQHVARRLETGNPRLR